MSAAAQHINTATIAAGSDESSHTAPVVAAEVNDPGRAWLVQVRCPFCGSLHRHGWDQLGSAWRVAHCGNRGEYRITDPSGVLGDE